MLKQFREFINQGNVVDVAVGFVMGAAFTTVVTAMVDRIVNPLIGLFFDVGGLAGVGTFGEGGSIGAVIGAVIHFLLVGLVLFLVVKSYNRVRSAKDEEEAEEEPDTPEDVVLLREIRDALREGSH